MLKKYIQLVSVFSLLALLSACSLTPRVSADFDTSFSFQKFNSYHWAPAKGEGNKFQTLYGKRVAEAIESNLASKGHKKATSMANADFLVHYHVDVSRKVDIDTYYDAWGYRGYWGYYGPHHLNRSTTTVREYKQGTLVVDIIDQASKTVVWRASAADTLHKNMTPEERNAKITQVVDAILAKFPPQPKS